MTRIVKKIEDFGGVENEVYVLGCKEMKFAS